MSRRHVARITSSCVYRRSIDDRSLIRQHTRPSVPCCLRMVYRIPAAKSVPGCDMMALFGGARQIYAILCSRAFIIPLMSTTLPTLDESTMSPRIIVVPRSISPLHTKSIRGGTIRQHESSSYPYFASKRVVYSAKACFAVRHHYTSNLESWRWLATRERILCSRSCVFSSNRRHCSSLLKPLHSLCA